MRGLIISESVKTIEDINNILEIKEYSYKCVEFLINSNAIDAIMSFRRAIESRRGFDYIFLDESLKLNENNLFIEELERVEEEYFNKKEVKLITFSMNGSLALEISGEKKKKKSPMKHRGVLKSKERA